MTTPHDEPNFRRGVDRPGSTRLLTNFVATAQDAVLRDESTAYGLRGGPSRSPEKLRFSCGGCLAGVVTVVVLAAIAVPSGHHHYGPEYGFAKQVEEEFRSHRIALVSYHVDNDAYPRMTWNRVYRDAAVPPWLGNGEPKEPIASHGAIAWSRPRDAKGAVVPHAAWGCLAEPVDYPSRQFDGIAPRYHEIEDPIDDFVPHTAGRYVYFHAEQYWELRERLGPRFQERHPFKPKDRSEVDDFVRLHGAWVLWHPGPSGYAEYAASGRGPFVAYDPTNGSNSIGSLFISESRPERWRSMRPGDHELFLGR